MKNIRKFETVADYEAWMSGDAVFPNVCYVAEDGRIAYNLPPVPLYIEAIENLTVTFGNTYEYSKDNSTWTSGTSSTSISANAGEKVYFRASGLTPYSSSGIGAFTISNGKCNVGGNVMSMAYGADYNGQTSITKMYQFTKLFYNAANIVDASNLILPATTLVNTCYSYMFSGCKSLVNAPALPAVTLKNYCYQYMFEGCTSLVNAPTLPSTTLATSCYNSMFRNCYSLVTAPELPATNLVESCYQSMFEGCSRLNYIKAMFTTEPSSSYTSSWVSSVSSSGTFVKNSAATWENTFGTSAIPSGWTVETADA